MNYSTKNRLKSLLATVILSIIAILFIYPFIWMFFSSFKSNSEIAKPMTLVPDTLSPSFYMEGQDLKSNTTAIKEDTIDKASRFREKRRLKYQQQITDLSNRIEKETDALLKSQLITEKAQVEERLNALNAKDKQTKKDSIPTARTTRSFSQAITLMIENFDFRYYEMLFSNNADLVKSKRELALSYRSQANDKAEIDEARQLIIKAETLEEEAIALSKHDYFDFKAVFFNSLFMSILQAFGAVLLCSAAGFVFAQYQFRAKRLLFMFAILLILIPKQVLVLPLFEWIDFIKLSDNQWGVILPGCLSGIGLIFFTQIFKQVPRDLIDLARIEGANELKVYLTILPLIKSSLLTFGLIHFIFAWNEHLIPLIILQSEEKISLNLALSSLWDSSMGQPLAVIMAGAIFTMLPAVVLFAILYKRIKSALADLIIH